MSLKSITRYLIAIGCMAGLPLYAQTTTTTTTTSTKTMTHKATTESKTSTKAESKPAEHKETKVEEKKETKSEQKAEKKSVSPKKAHATALSADATRLAAILQDTQASAKISDASWKTIANESNALARKLHAAAKGSMKQPAAEAQKHVAEMRSAALKGDAAGAKTHASLALPYLYKIIDASAGSKM